MRETLTIAGQRGKKKRVTSVATKKVWSPLQCCRAGYGRGPRDAGSEHVHDIRSAGRIGKQHLLQLVGTDAKPHRYRKDVNHLLGVRP